MIVGKILPTKLRHMYYFWKSKHLVWKRSLWCDCGIGYIPADVNTIYNPELPNEIQVWFWQKIDTNCPICWSNTNQYHICWDTTTGVYCEKCRFTYRTDYIGEPPRGKKYKGEQGVSN